MPNTNDQRGLVEINVPNTRFKIRGEQKENLLWNIYLTDPVTNLKDIIRKNATTESFIIFSNVILKTPFPAQGKKAENSSKVKKFIKKLIKKQNVRRNKSRSNIRNKSSKLQTRSKKRS